MRELKPSARRVQEALAERGFDGIWAAAGTPNAVFRLAPGDLARLTGGQAAVIKQGGAPNRP